MLDQFNRNINYLRISVTDKCNLRCTYCMPECGVQLLNHDNIISFEEIIDVIKVGLSIGINKIRLTGGEPLVRKGIVKLVEMISNLHGIEDIAMTTNGILLDKFALPLKQAGLHRVNISLDTVNEEIYRKITRGGDINNVYRGIEASKRAGLAPVKINCVVFPDSRKEDKARIVEFCKINDIQYRFIRQMNLKTGKFSKVDGGEGGNCNICNRIRLTSDGKLKPCLFGDLEFDIRKLGIREAMTQAIFQKPKCGIYSARNEFYNIGG